MIYILKSAITLALLYSCFFFFLSKETFHRFNRCMLVGILLTSLVVPLFHFTTEHPTVINEELYEMESLMASHTDPKGISILNPATVSPSGDERGAMTVVQNVYLMGVAVMLLLTLLQAVSLVRLMHGGLKHTDSQGNTVVLLKGEVTPFSIFRYIVMNVRDYEQHHRYILAHEQEHIRLGHSYDLLLLEAMKTLQWFNPFVWFISRDLKAVHEYEADRAVIQQGIDAKSYQQLLVAKVVGNRLQTFTNNLSHGSLKKRILMMYQKPSKRWLMLKALCAIPVVALTLNAFATPSDTDPVEDMVKTLENTEVPRLNELKENVTATAATADENALPFGDNQDPQDASSQTPEIPIGADTCLTPIDSKTLIVLDGKHLSTEKFLALNMTSEDVESADILGSTSATALFGEEGKYGAIVITTKAGSQTANGQKHDGARNDDETVFEICEEPAQYVGGDAALQTFLSQNVRYPKVARENGIQGRVLVSFIVEKDGTCSHFTANGADAHNADGVSVVVIAQNAMKKLQETGTASPTPKEALEWGSALEEEALRVFRLMGKWEPAKQHGKAVRMRKTLPLTFRLQ